MLAMILSFFGKIFRYSPIVKERLAMCLKFLKDVRLQFILAVISGALYGVISGFGVPIILKFAADNIFSGENVSSTLVIAATFGPFLIMCARAVLEVSNAYLIGYCGQHILQGLRLMVFSKLQRLPLEYFRKTEPGQIITRNLNDTAMLQAAMLEVSQEIIKQPITLCGAIGAIVYMCFQQSDIAILLIFIAAIPLIIYPIKIIGNRLKKKTTQMQRDNEMLTTMVSHNLSAAQEIRAFGLQGREVSNYSSLCQRLSRSVISTLKYAALSSPLVEVVAAGGVGIAMFYCYKANIGAPAFLALSGALYFSYDPVKKLVRLNNSVKSGAACLGRIEQLLKEPETISDPINPVKVDRLNGDISFNHVTFSYDSKNIVLNDINEKFNHGKTYALVGSSGGGKTTLTNLILRFYDVIGGKVAIDGIDVRNLTLDDLRKNISYVPQSPSLINGTIEDNILWGKLDATHDEVEIAAKNAYAHDFIVGLPNGYQTIVGEGGACISGGQKQRIAVARAFLRDTPILILDEATSALDSNSEHAIFLAIQRLVKNKTAILIAHRFTMMSIVDEVLVVDAGKIIERGSPKELGSDKNSMYYSLSSKQNLLNK